ncbi:MAG: crossover junction endodeoxyribonuclease RuvC [Deltaproteobacteria bacterium]|nr:crossover junction endodeoxyribonuclease RuvC [Deltaproteobacteria bacterium]
MIIFGIDPGSVRTGWGVVRSEGSRIAFVDAGVVRAPAESELSHRMERIFVELNAKLREYGPDHVFLESVFHHKSAKSALILGHARGVALLAARLSAARIDELSPAEIKKAVTGHGRAEKPQVQEMVRIILGLAERAQADAADALAVAIAGVQRARSPLAAMLDRRRGTR